MTRKDYIIITKLYNLGMRGREIAERLNISEGHIYRVVRKVRGMTYEERLRHLKDCRTNSHRTQRVGRKNLS